MPPQLDDILHAYDVDLPLARASTIPSAFYTDPRIHSLERRHVFGRTWQWAGRIDQVSEAGHYLTLDIAGEPILVVRGRDGVLRGFFNVCRHHAAAVAAEPQGCAGVLRCPYHGWTYALDGSLKGTPEFDGVAGFDAADSGLISVRVDTWEGFVFVCLDAAAPGLSESLGELASRVAPLDLAGLRFAERRTYDLACNWKVFIDNYLDGGYHVPHVHKGLGSVLTYRDYTIETRERFCVQSCPIESAGGDADVAAVRGGDMAYYYWLYPNLMLNWYEGYLDINVALPLGVDRTRVIFDFFFADSSQQERSVAVADRVQQEDIDVCESVQRGLASQAYDVGRLSVRREAGEHRFHRLLCEDLRSAD
ncbi:MAG: aromatic ring-hydroxylating dioxygenase subunit alpha [Phycisphaerae bacterium]